MNSSAWESVGARRVRDYSYMVAVALYRLKDCRRWERWSMFNALGVADAMPQCARALFIYAARAKVRKLLRPGCDCSDIYAAAPRLNKCTATPT